MLDRKSCTVPRKLFTFVFSPLVVPLNIVYMFWILELLVLLFSCNLSLLLNLFNSKLKCLIVQLLLFSTSNHSAYFLLRINKERFINDFLHFALNRETQLAYFHLPNIARLTTSYSGVLLA